MDDDKTGMIQQLAAFVTIPFVLAVPPVVGWWMGSYMDDYFGTAPYLMYLMIVMGFIAGFRELFRIVRRYGQGAPGTKDTKDHKDTKDTNDN